MKQTKRRKIWNSYAQAKGYAASTGETTTPTPAFEPGCDCVHPSGFHDPETGACLYTNPAHGPCPCAATSVRTRAALWRVHRELRKQQRRDHE